MSTNAPHRLGKQLNRAQSNKGFAVNQSEQISQRITIHQSSSSHCSSSSKENKSFFFFRFAVATLHGDCILKLTNRVCVCFQMCSRIHWMPQTAHIYEFSSSFCASWFMWHSIYIDCDRDTTQHAYPSYAPFLSMREHAVRVRASASIFFFRWPLNCLRSFKWEIFGILARPKMNPNELMNEWARWWMVNTSNVIAVRHRVIDNKTNAD